MAPGGTMMENFLDVHKLLPDMQSTTDVYIAILGDTEKEAGKLARSLRTQGINVELGASDQKLDKQLKTVIKKAIPYILFMGEEEVRSGIYTIKNIAKSQEYKLDLTGIAELIKE